MAGRLGRGARQDMGISTLTFSDEINGRLFAAWVDEVVYSIGRHADFDSIKLPTRDAIILSLVCLPANLAGAAKSGTRLKRSAREFWSTAFANYDDFTSNDPIAKIDCIGGALAAAIRQLPESRMPNSAKAGLLSAISAGAADLSIEPQRHPR